jgi:hypothetical protein
MAPFINKSVSRRQWISGYARSALWFEEVQNGW